MLAGYLCPAQPKSRPGKEVSESKRGNRTPLKEEFLKTKAGLASWGSREL